MMIGRFVIEKETGYIHIYKLNEYLNDVVWDGIYINIPFN